MKQANEARFKFDVSGFMNYDAPMIMEYSKGCHYDWHIDVGKAVPNRKLSYTIQLSKPDDYEGGDLEFLGTETNTEAFRQQGTCIIFPSFLAHKVTKVKNGTRYAVVGWVHGPTYK
jgi:PKHD-type hydroxylase